MLKAYLFIFNNDVGTRDEVKKVINSIESISKWRFDIPHSFYVISESSAQKLYEDFVKINGTKGRFMFIEASANSQGQMMKDTWYLLKNKTYRPKDKE